MSLTPHNFSITNAVDKIWELIKQERWEEAHQACIEVLRFDPNFVKVLRLKKKIEKKVKKINTRAIKEDVKKLKKLWKQELYDQFYQHLQELRPFITDYPKLGNFVVKAEKKLQQKQINEQKKKIKVVDNIIQELLRENKFTEALTTTQNLPLSEYNLTDISNIVQNIKNRWIDHSIEESTQKFQEDQYEEKLSYLESLRSIDNQSKKLDQTIKIVKKEQYLAQLDKHRDKIYKSFENIKILIQLKKYQQAVQALEEILSIDTENKKARKLLKKAQKKASRVRDMKLLEQIDKAHKNAPTKDFIKL